MALSDYKLTSFTNPVASLDDKPQMSAADLKAKFDANSEELKTKVNGLIDELTDELGDKVDAVNGKGLSTNDYTTEEKTKLAGVEANANNYAHPVSHSADMIVETDAKRFTSNSEMNTKVDRVTGKGLSTNDYTTEEKTKLAEIDVSKEHTHTNKSILDAITCANQLPYIAWADMDSFTGEIAIVTRQQSANTGNSYTYKNVLLQHSYYYTFDGAQDSPLYRQQILFSDDKSVKQRTFDPCENENEGAWSDWEAIGNVHNHANKSILDDITVAPIADAPSDNKQYARKNGTWAETLSGLKVVDFNGTEINAKHGETGYLEAGLYCVVNNDGEQGGFHNANDTLNKRGLLIVSSWDYYDPYEFYTYQTIIWGYDTPTALYRSQMHHYDTYSGNTQPISNNDWTAWTEKTIGYTNTLEAINNAPDGASYSAFSFSSRRCYKLARTTTDAKMLSFNTPATTSYVNEIEIYMTVEANESVLWGSNVIFVDSEIPTLTTGKYYRVIAEFDPIADKWCVGVIESGASA